MGAIRDLAERCWAGDFGNEIISFLQPTFQYEEISKGFHFIHAFGNVNILETSEGLVLIDTGMSVTSSQIFKTVRSISEALVHTAIYTHGHMDHASGLPPFLTEAKEKGLPRPRIIGHKNVVSRFDRYRRMSGYTARIRGRWPKNFDYPDTIYTEMLTVKVGDTMLDLYHAKGETDDHTWVWWPESKTVFTGDLFTWVSPNAGSPRQVQRYPEEWASALHTMSALSPEVLIPGHGFPCFGVECIRQALNDTAQWLDSLVKQTIDLMNEGKILDQILQVVKPPAHLIGRPYLLSIYVDPEHIVRNIWQLYGGWYDGIPSNLNPAPQALLAREVLSLAGGVEVVTNRARDLAKAGDLQLASHLIDWACAAQPENKDAKSIRSEIYNERMERSLFLVSKGIYGEAARESKES